MSTKEGTFDQICFVISPIGQEGTDTHTRFHEILDYIIRPAVEASGHNLQVLRADQIQHPGSFIKDILEYISSSFVVIADLTGQNPNVFYELGVRHSLSPRTILISQNLEDLPADLREYRTIIYDTSAKGGATFKEKLVKYLTDIVQDPLRPDNPVLDRLGTVVGTRIGELQQENILLRSQLESVLKKGEKEAMKILELRKDDGLFIRLDRILKIMSAERKYSTLFGRYDLPEGQGSFAGHLTSEGSTIERFLYISGPHVSVDFVKELADARVLMEQCSRGQKISITFVIVSAHDYTTEKPKLEEQFHQIKQFLTPANRDRFSLEIWDGPTITQKEYELGIKLPPQLEASVAPPD
jgi:hypothetical protein